MLAAWRGPQGAPGVPRAWIGIQLLLRSGGARLQHARRCKHGGRRASIGSSCGAAGGAWAPLGAAARVSRHHMSPCGAAGHTSGMAIFPRAGGLATGIAVPRWPRMCLHAERCCLAPSCGNMALKQRAHWRLWRAIIDPPFPRGKQASHPNPANSPRLAVPAGGASRPFPPRRFAGPVVR